MDGLRWLLLLFGVLVIAGVYVYSRRQAEKPPDDNNDERRIAPTLGQEPPAETTSGPTSGPIEDVAPEPVMPVKGEQKIVTLRLIPKGAGAFAGDELILSLRGIGLRHGKFGIFHRYDGNDDSRTVFSVASLVEPGSFDLSNIKEQEIPGVSLFMVLPGPVDSVDAFDMMMAAARALAQSLSAELLDESGSSLSIQRERYLREEVIQFQHSNLVA